MYVDDTGSITMMEIRSKARRLKSKHADLGLIVVDYLQLMTSGRMWRTACRRSRRSPARSRCSRATSTFRSSPCRSSPARSSSATTSARSCPTSGVRLDRAGRGHRHVHLPRRLLQPEDSADPGVAEVIVAKHRNGPTDKVKLSFIAQYAKFADLAAI